MFGTEVSALDISEDSDSAREELWWDSRWDETLSFPPQVSDFDLGILLGDVLPRPEVGAVLLPKWEVWEVVVVG